MSEKESRLGRFFINGCYREYDILRAVQHGCAVVRCEYLAYADRYEIWAEHPDFEPVERGLMIPLYEAELTTDIKGNICRKKFKRLDQD